MLLCFILFFPLFAANRFYGSIGMIIWSHCNLQSLILIWIYTFNQFELIGSTLKVYAKCIIQNRLDQIISVQCLTRDQSVSRFVFLVVLHYIWGCFHVSINSMWNNSRLENSPSCRLAPGPHGKLWKAFHRMSQAHSDRANQTKTMYLFTWLLTLWCTEYCQ